MRDSNIGIRSIPVISIKQYGRLYNYKDSSVLKMGVSAINSHMNGKNHQRVKNVTSPSQSLYFKPKEPDETDKENCSDCVPSTSSATKDVVVEPKKQAMISKPSVRALDAEIRCVLKIFMIHHLTGLV